MVVSTVNKAFALHTVNLTSIPDANYGFLRISRSQY